MLKALKSVPRRHIIVSKATYVRNNSYHNLIITYFTIFIAKNNKEFRKITAFVAARQVRRCNLSW
jgi:hypothetical protein